MVLHDRICERFWAMNCLAGLAEHVWIVTRIMVLVVSLPDPCRAVSSAQFDNFGGGALHGWGYSTASTPVGNVAENGPSAIDAGVGALLMDTNLYGNGKLVVTNTTAWTGDWTNAGIAQIAMDVRNPNAFGLSMHIGIAGPGGAGALGDVHVTPSISVAADNEWHVLTFDVLAANFTSITSTNIVAALAAVTQMRIFHNPSNGVFTGANGGEFLLDNIRVVAPSLSGDYNQNGVVDAADYIVWRNDPNHTQAGYDLWRAHFGQTAGSGSGASANAAVPEPTTLVLVIVGTLTLPSRRRD